MMSSAIRLNFEICQDAFAMRAELDLPGKGITALYGHSGAGKTTLLRAVAGLARYPGYLHINEETWQDDARSIFVPTYRRALGYVFQEASLLPHLTVRRNLEFGWSRTAPSERKVDREHILGLLGIEHLLDRRPAGLSGGERQRVAIARALFASPKLLLMDEPLAALDVARKQEVLPYLERIHGELATPMIYVSHSAEEVARLADHIVLLDAGRILASGAVAEISARLDLPIAFDEQAGVVLEGVVEAFDETYQLARLHIAGNRIQVPHRKLAVGSCVRLRILARDVSLTLGSHNDTSVLNQLPGRIVELAESTSAAYVMARIDVGGISLLARITRYSLDALNIHPGKPVWVQFKASTVLTTY